MKCTSCSKTLKDGTSICPHCDAILDDSFLGSMPGGDHGEDTPLPEEAAPPRASGPKKTVPARPTRAAAPRTAPSQPAAKKPAVRRRAPVEEAEPEEAPPEPAAPAEGGYVNKYSQYWTDEEPAPKKSAPRPAAAASAAPAASAAKPGAADPAAPGDELGDPLQYVKPVWNAFLGLHFEDKLTVISGMSLSLMACTPWHSTAESDDLGLLGWGFFALLLGGLGVVSVWARHTGKLEKVIPSAKMPLLAQAAGGLSALIAFLSIVGGFERAARNGKTELVGWPGFGAWLSLVCAALLVLGGVLTAKREKQG